MDALYQRDLDEFGGDDANQEVPPPPASDPTQHPSWSSPESESPPLSESPPPQSLAPPEFSQQREDYAEPPSPTNCTMRRLARSHTRRSAASARTSTSTRRVWSRRRWRGAAAGLTLSAHWPHCRAGQRIASVRLAWGRGLTHGHPREPCTLRATPLQHNSRHRATAGCSLHCCALSRRLYCRVLHCTTGWDGCAAC